MNLKHKIVVITGGTKGLGKEIAEFFAESGSKVLICSRKTPENHLKGYIFRKSNRREKASRMLQSKRFIFAMGIS